jgi:hypothetical protein
VEEKPRRRPMQKPIVDEALAFGKAVLAQFPLIQDLDIPRCLSDMKALNPEKQLEMNPVQAMHFVHMALYAAEKRQNRDLHWRL